MRHEQRLGTSPDVGNPSGFRFARFYLQQRREAQALVGVLRGFPLALRTFRGIDLCTDEAGVPIWVMAPLMRWVREAGQAAAALLRDRGIESVPPLRTTVHAGEDFVHLLTGLRRLDEAIRHLGLEEGDRIGHGMALGLDPTTWFGRIGRVVQTREERLLDLVWEWDFYAKSHADVGSGRLSYLRSNIARLGEHVFGETVTPEDLVHLIRALHCERELKGQGFPAGVDAGPQGSNTDRNRRNRGGGCCGATCGVRKSGETDVFRKRLLSVTCRTNSRLFTAFRVRFGERWGSGLDGRGQPFVQPPDR